MKSIVLAVQTIALILRSCDAVPAGILSSEPVKVGTDPGFYKAADILRDAINETVNPCDDFYEFSCGKWISTHEIPDDMTSYGRYSELQKKIYMEMRNLYEENINSSSVAIRTAKRLYAACTDVNKLNALKSSLLLKKIEEFGYWPILHGDKWSKDDFDLTKLLIQLMKSRYTEYLMHLYIATDLKNVTRQLLYFDQGGLGLSRKYYLNETRYSKQLNAYTEYMRSTIKLLASDAGLNRTDEEIAAGVKSIVDFEKELAKILVPENERRNISRLYNPRKFSDLSSLFGEINWNDYFHALMPEDMHDYLAGDPEVIVNEVEYFDRLSSLLNRTDRRTVADYVMWSYASVWSFQLDERYEDIRQTFWEAFIGKQTKSPRWKDCLSKAGNLMKYADSALYVRNYFEKQDRALVLEIINDLKLAFIEMLKESDWLDDKTKAYAVEKSNEMKNFVGFPDFICNDTALDEHYANLNISTEDEFATIIEKRNRWMLDKEFRQFKANDLTSFRSSSSAVEAYNALSENAIILSAAILQAPLFDRSFPKAVNYGGIGAVIGHEITHGFDNTGSQLDKLGNLRNWWNAATHLVYQNRTQCFIDQYSSYEVPGTNMTINGVLTQGENVADNIGVKQSYQAYRAFIKKLGHEESRLPGLEKYTNDQVFFISSAQLWCGQMKSRTQSLYLLEDSHSPTRFRVNGAVVNQPEFAAAFNCSAGSPMNPRKKCSMW